MSEGAGTHTVNHGVWVVEHQQLFVNKRCTSQTGSVIHCFLSECQLYLRYLCCWLIAKKVIEKCGV